MTQLNLTFAQIKWILGIVLTIILVGVVYYKYASWKQSIYDAGYSAGQTAGAAKARKSCQEDITDIQNAPWRKTAPKKPLQRCSGFSPLCWVGVR